MEFDKSRVYTSANADELSAGDKVITARNLYGIKQQVKMFTGAVDVIDVILNEDYFNRFKVQNDESYPLAYLVERKENCTNCIHYTEVCLDCLKGKDHKCYRYKRYECSEYKPKTEQKAEKHYRPFKDTDELVKVWDAKIGTPNWGTDGDLTMPHIWVRNKVMKSSVSLIIDFDNDGVMLQKQRPTWVTLFDCFEFLDGSPCGVEE